MNNTNLNEAQSDSALAGQAERRVMRNYANYVKTKTGDVRAICECCGKKSTPIKPNKDGEPDIWNLSTNWWQAPFPHDFVHDDGSRGSTHTCPDCYKKLKSGKSVKLRQYDA